MHILPKAADWYRPTGVDLERVLAQTLHPIAHYAALLLKEDDTDDLLPPEAIHAHLRTGEPRLGDLDWTTSTSMHDQALIAVLNEHLAGKIVVPFRVAHKESISAAVRLLDSVLPALAHDSLPYVSRVALTNDDDRIGETMRDFPYVMILGPAAFGNDKMLAEALFHEALHSKVIVMERSASLVRDYDFECTDVLEIPWRLDDDGNWVKWSVERAFMAHHVYAHLTLFWTAMWQRDRGEHDLDQLRRVCFRAAYLSQNLANTSRRAKRHGRCKVRNPALAGPLESTGVRFERRRTGASELM